MVYPENDHIWFSPILALIVIFTMDKQNKKSEDLLNQGSNLEKIQPTLLNQKVYQSIFDSSNDAIGISKSGVNLFFNQSYLDLFGYTSNSELIGTSILNQIAPEEHDRIKKIVQKRSKTTDTPVFYETTGLKADGARFPFEIKVSTVETDNETITVVIIRDISERKKSEKLIQNTLEYNNVLFNEFKHRTKNSFAILSSLTRLLTNKKNSQETIDALKNINSKIIAVSEVYSQLDMQGSDTNIQFDKYIQKIAHSTIVLSDNIDLKTSIDACELSATKTCNIGIIIAEILTNSVKHAFPVNSNGEIILQVRNHKEKVVITVKDNGVGFSNKKELENINSFGLNFIYSIAEQIRASITMERNNGTIFILEIEK